MLDLAARRRRAWFSLILVSTFGLLAIALLLPATPGSIRVDQAGADETMPTARVAAIDPVTASTEAPATSTTAATVESAPSTAPPSTSAPAKKPRSVSATDAPAPVVAAPAPPPVVSPSPSVSAAAFLACIRNRESHNDYTTVSTSGSYRGAYQFNQSAWDSTARHAGRDDLVGQQANLVSPADQDALALDLYLWQGSRPWGGACD